MVSHVAPAIDRQHRLSSLRSRLRRTQSRSWPPPARRSTTFAPGSLGRLSRQRPTDCGRSTGVWRDAIWRMSGQLRQRWRKPESGTTNRMADFAERVFSNTRVVNSDRLKMMNATALICFHCLIRTGNERRHETIVDKGII